MEFPQYLGQKAFPKRGRGTGWGRVWQFEGNRTKICHLLHVKCISRSRSTPYKARSFPFYVRVLSRVSREELQRPATRLPYPTPRRVLAGAGPGTPALAPGPQPSKRKETRAPRGPAGVGGLRGEKGLHEQPSRGNGRNVGLQEVGVASRPGA